MSETRPSRMSVREKIQAGVSAGYVREVPGLLDALDAHASMTAEVDDRPLIADEKTRQKAALVDALHPQIDEAVAAAIQQATRDLDREEGALRAALQDVDAEPKAMLRVTRAQMFASQASQALDASEVDGAFTGAELTADVEIVRATGLAARKRLADLSAPALKHPPSVQDAARAAFLRFEARFADWVKAHPSPADRLAQIGRERYNVATAIAQSAVFAAKMYGVSQPPPKVERRPVPSVPDSRIKEGPGFDLLTGRNSTHARR